MGIEKLLENNATWAAGQRARDPDFFTRLAGQQSPSYLWIGCSDSRVPANEIVGLPPGEVFVHRNVANLVVHSDLNCLSVMQYAVEVLKVRHIIVCGHYGCGGVEAALSDQRHGLIDNWLMHLRDLCRLHQAALDKIPDHIDRLRRVCELNVLTQAYNVCSTTIVQDAWQKSQELSVHAWIYAIEDGVLRDLGRTLSSQEEFDAIARG